MPGPAYWVEKLNLQAHPEGGWFAETYRSTATFPGETPPGGRPHATAIYFLLTGENFSAFHRLRYDEIWHFYAGSGMELHAIAPDGALATTLLGPDAENAAVFQARMPAGHWFAGRVPQPGGYALVGCTMAPGFDFRDFELADRATLSAEFPQHAALIASLTR